MKKIFSLLLAAAMLASMCACGKSNNKKEETEMTTTEFEPEYSAKKYKAKDIADKIKLTGRANIGDDGIHLDWTWAGAVMHGWFDGDIVADYSLGYGTLSDIRVVVDGDFENASVHTVKPIGGESGKDLVLCTVEKGEHEIAIYKCSQAVNGGANIDNIRFNGCLADKPADNDLRIEIIGDSISCGAGAVDNGRSEGQADDSYYAYGAILAREIPADTTVVAVSGWGLACGGMDYNALIPNIYEKTCSFRNDEAFSFENDDTDVVIIALGTNDYRFANERRFDEFIGAARSFLRRVRELHPKATIIWIYGQMLNQYNLMLESMVAEENATDGNMYYFDVKHNVAGGYGHPDAEGHRDYADFLKGKIAELVK